MAPRTELVLARSKEAHVGEMLEGLPRGIAMRVTHEDHRVVRGDVGRTAQPCDFGARVRREALEVVEHDHTGWVLQDPHDATAVADRVMALASDEALRKRMAAASRETAERYTWDTHFEQMLALYDEVAELKRAAAATP